MGIGGLRAWGDSVRIYRENSQDEDHTGILLKQMPYGMVPSYMLDLVPSVPTGSRVTVLWMCGWRSGGLQNVYVGGGI